MSLFSALFRPPLSDLAVGAGIAAKSAAAAGDFLRRLKGEACKDSQRTRTSALAFGSLVELLGSGSAADKLRIANVMQRKLDKPAELSRHHARLKKCYLTAATGSPSRQCSKRPIVRSRSKTELTADENQLKHLLQELQQLPKKEATAAKAGSRRWSCAGSCVSSAAWPCLSGRWSKALCLLDIASASPSTLPTELLLGRS